MVYKLAIMATLVSMSCADEQSFESSARKAHLSDDASSAPVSEPEPKTEVVTQEEATSPEPQAETETTEVSPPAMTGGAFLACPPAYSAAIAPLIS